MDAYGRLSAPEGEVAMRQPGEAWGRKNGDGFGACLWVERESRESASRLGGVGRRGQPRPPAETGWHFEDRVKIGITRIERRASTVGRSQKIKRIQPTR